MRIPDFPDSFSIDGLRSWARELVNALREREPCSAPDTLMSRTTRGTSIWARGGTDSAPSDTLSYKGEWVAGYYTAGDIVIRGGGLPETAADTTPVLDTGRVAGSYIALFDVNPEDAPPGTVPMHATATATISGGAVTALTLTDCGGGYVYAPVVTISGGGGSGATAIALLAPDGSLALLLTAGGTGYTSAPTVIIEYPPGEQKWADLARGRWPKLTIAPAADARVKQVIVLDAGRDSGLPILKINKDKDSDTPGSIQLDLNALVAISGAGDLIIKPREWDVCVDGAAMQAIFLSSAPY